MPPPESRVLLGEIVGVHGVQGQVRVRAHTADPLDVTAYGPLTAEPGGRALVLNDLREVKGGVVIARVPGVASRDAAEALKGLRLYVPRSALPVPDDEEEFYHADLEGLRAELPEGESFGKVRRVANFGAGDMLEIDRAEGGSVLIPFSKAAVPVVDIAGGRVVVDPPAGLLDDPKAEKAEDEAS